MDMTHGNPQQWDNYSDPLLDQHPSVGNPYDDTPRSLMHPDQRMDRRNSRVGMPPESSEWYPSPPTSSPYQQTHPSSYSNPMESPYRSKRPMEDPYMDDLDFPRGDGTYPRRETLLEVRDSNIGNNGQKAIQYYKKMLRGGGGGKSTHLDMSSDDNDPSSKRPTLIDISKQNALHRNNPGRMSRDPEFLDDQRHSLTQSRRWNTRGNEIKRNVNPIDTGDIDTNGKFDIIHSDDGDGGVDDGDDEYSDILEARKERDKRKKTIKKRQDKDEKQNKQESGDKKEGEDTKLHTPHWGRCGWSFMHFIAANFPLDPTPQQIEWYRVFFYSIGHVLPCQEICGPDFLNIIHDKIPYRGSNRQELQEWLVDAHNDVNRKVGKPILPLDEALSFYSNHNSGNGCPVTIPSKTSSSYSSETKTEEQKRYQRYLESYPDVKLPLSETSPSLSSTKPPTATTTPPPLDKQEQFERKSTTQENKKTSSSSPWTGDKNNIKRWLVILAIAGTLIYTSVKLAKYSPSLLSGILPRKQDPMTKHKYNEYIHPNNGGGGSGDNALNPDLSFNNNHNGNVAGIHNSSAQNFAGKENQYPRYNSSNNHGGGRGVVGHNDHYMRRSMSSKPSGSSILDGGSKRINQASQQQSAPPPPSSLTSQSKNMSRNFNIYS